MLTKKRINEAIAHTGLEVVGNGDGYFYFISLANGIQRGHCVYVCRLNHLALDKWVSAAEAASKSSLYEGIDYGDLEEPPTIGSAILDLCAIVAMSLIAIAKK